MTLYLLMAEDTNVQLKRHQWPKEPHQNHPPSIFWRQMRLVIQIFVALLLDRNHKTRTSFRFGVNVVRKVAPHNIARHRLRPSVHQALSVSKRRLRTTAPLALGADFLIWLICALLSAPSSGS